MAFTGLASAHPPLTPALPQYPQGLGTPEHQGLRWDGSCPVWAPRARSLAPQVTAGTAGNLVPCLARKGSYLFYTVVRRTPVRVRHRAPLPWPREPECGVVNRQTGARCCSRGNVGSARRISRSCISRSLPRGNSCDGHLPSVPRRPPSSSCLFFSQIV